MTIEDLVTKILLHCQPDIHGKMPSWEWRMDVVKHEIALHEAEVIERCIISAKVVRAEREDTSETAEEDINKLIEVLQDKVRALSQQKG